MQKHDPNPTSASMLFCDIDGTLLQRVRGPGLFMRYWIAYANTKQTILVYNTGRALEFVLQKVADGELFPAKMVIANQGANIYEGSSLWSPWVEYMAANGYTMELLDDIEKVVRECNISPCQVEVERFDLSLRWWIKGGSTLEQCASKYMLVCKALPMSSLYWLNVYTHQEIQEQFQEGDQDWGIGCVMYSNLVKGSKASAAEFVERRITDQGKKTFLVMWAGDGENAMHMIETTFKGIVVNNAHPALIEACRQDRHGDRIFRALADGENGVIEGLQYWDPVLRGE